MFNKVQRYSIRKLTIGAASVLIGIAFVGVNANVVHADNTPSSEVKSVANANASKRSSMLNTPQATAQPTTASEQESSQSSIVANASDKGNNDNQVSSPVYVAQKTTASEVKTPATPTASASKSAQPSQNSKASEPTKPIQPATKKSSISSPSQPTTAASSKTTTPAEQTLNTKNLEKEPTKDLNDNKITDPGDATIKQLDDDHTLIYGRNGSIDNNGWKGAQSYQLAINGGAVLDNTTLSSVNAIELVQAGTKEIKNAEWVTDISGKQVVDSTHQYDTKWTDHNAFTAYIKVTYKDSKGYTILPVAVGIKSDAEQYDQDFFNDLDYFNTHSVYQPNAPHYDYDWSDTNHNAKLEDKYDGDIPQNDQLTWGYDINNIVWNNNVSQDKIDIYKEVIKGFQSAGRHRSPAYLTPDDTVGTDLYGNKYSDQRPGMDIIYQDGSSTADVRHDGNPRIDAHVFRALFKNPSSDFITANKEMDDGRVDKYTYQTATYQAVAGDSQAFTPTTAKDQLTNLADEAGTNAKNRGSLFNFTQNYSWVIADPNSNKIDGIQVTGFRALTADDIKKVGTQRFYIMVRYTKTASGEQDGYDLLPVDVTLNAGIHATGTTKIFDNKSVTTRNIFDALNSTDNNSRIEIETQDNKALIIPSDLEPTDFTWQTNTDPIYAGTYYLDLTPDGLTKLKNANPNATAEIGHNFQIKYIIKKADANATLSGKASKDFDNSAFQNSQLNQDDKSGSIGIKLSFPGDDSPKDPSSKNTTYILQDGDYTWYTSLNSTTPYANIIDSIDYGPVKVGTYYLRLSMQGKDNIVSWIKKNYNSKLTDSLNWDTILQNKDYATFTINQLHVKFNLTGTSSKVYDGQQAAIGTVNLLPSIGADTSKNIYIQSNYPKLERIDIDPGDLTWNGKQVSQGPKDVGTYCLGISDAMRNALKHQLTLAAGKSLKGNIDNVIFDSITSEAKYIITPASKVIVHYYDDTDSAHPTEITSQTKDFTNPAQNPGMFSFTPSDFTKNWNYTQAGWTLEKKDNDINYPTSGNKSSDGNYYVADYNVYLKAANYTTKTITRQVKYVDGFGNALNPTDSTLPATTVTLDLKYVPIVDNNGNITNYKWQLATIGSKIVDFPAPETITIDGKTYSLNTANSHYALQADDQPTNLITKHNGTFSLVQTDLAALANSSTYTITLPYLLNFDVSYSGQDGKTYDGQTGIIDPSKVNSWQEKNNDAELTLPTGETLSIPTNWVANTDFHWIDKDGNNASVPTDVGIYYIALTQDGINKLKAANKNYQINNVSGKITYTINPQPEPPTQPTEPTKPTQPTGNGGQNTDAPTQPTQASQNTKASSPSKPTAPAKPTSPAKPSKPGKPAKPNKPHKSKPNKPGKPTKPNKVNKLSKGKPNKGKTTNGPIHGEKNTSKKSSPWSKNNRPKYGRMPEGIKKANRWSNNNMPLSAKAPENGRRANAAPELDRRMMVRPETRRTDRYDQNRHSFFGKKGMLPETGEDHANHNILTAVGMAITSLVGLFGFASRKKKKDE